MFNFVYMVHLQTKGSVYSFLYLVTCFILSGQTDFIATIYPPTLALGYEFVWKLPILWEEKSNTYLLWYLRIHCKFTLLSRNRQWTHKYIHTVYQCIAVDARAPSCPGRCWAMSLAPGCVFTLKSFLLSRCAYKTAPDDGALVIKA